MAIGEAPARSVRGMAARANPAFAGGAVAVPLVALSYAVFAGDLETLTYVHVMAGVLWTGTDLFVGAVLGPVLGGLDVEQRAAVFRRFTPKMTFLMPTLAVVTVVGGVVLAIRLDKFPHAEPWLALTSTAIALPVVGLIAAQFDALTDPRAIGVAAVLTVAHAAWLVTAWPAMGPVPLPILLALAVVVLLSVVGFGLLLPGEVRIYVETVSADPDEELIGEIGLRNARLAGLQGLGQLSIIALMVLIRWMDPVV